MSLLPRAFYPGLVAALLAGCGATERPSTIADWKSCIVAPGALEGTDAVNVVPKPGRAVWHAGAEWGRSLGRSEYQAGDLLIELPEALAPGATLRIDASTRSIYREGGEAVVYQAEGLEGTVIVEALTADQATLKVDLHASPTKDAGQRGPLALKGTVTAARKKQLSECR